MLIKEVRATSVTIQKPTNNQQFNSLLNGDHITFKFTIIGYYESYNTYIDGQLDHSLHHEGVDIQYDAKNFIDNYGRGLHTFDVSVSTGGPGPSVVTSFVMDSVSFTVDPPLCHFVGFGYDYYDEYSDEPLRWRSNIEPFRDTLLSDRAKYIPGYFATHYNWDDDDVISILDTLDTKEKQQDIVVVLFSAHGHAIYPPPSNAWIHSHTTTWFHNIGWAPGYVSVTSVELQDWLSDLETDNLIYIVDSCHSECFLYRGQLLTNEKHVMVACEWDEDSWHEQEAYNPSWSLATRIDNMNSLFLRKMCQSFYNSYYDTDAAFDAAYDWITIERPEWDQHPMDFNNLQTTLYLCHQP